MTCPLCRDTGEQRYWEGRWRDERALNAELVGVLEIILQIIDMRAAPHLVGMIRGAIANAKGEK